MVKDILVQQGLFKAFSNKKPESTLADDWEELKMKAMSAIPLCLVMRSSIIF
jgi:hypothetical protein